jgi:hypothetical protein
VVVTDPKLRKKLITQSTPLYKKWDEKVFGPIILGYPKGGFPGPKEKSPLPVKWF